MSQTLLSPAEIHAIIDKEFSGAISALNMNPTMPFFVVKDVDAWQAIAYFMREDSRLQFNYLSCITGVDLGAKESQLSSIYNFQSLGIHYHKITVKVIVPYDNPKIPSVAEIWKTAEWHEREAFDLLGIEYTAHPDLRRILCPDDWEGHPLRKDYKTQETYHGIKVPF
ncbi:MAG: NADH-quinone oxidoreductase subunit C [Chloroherpetonaceae bacterium]|nr:NADH-quinone oxidoreductase subunit C [Chloroherpetonaceae bacterium]